MAASSRPRAEVLATLLARHGRTYADEVGIHLRRGGAPELFQLLVAALLMSARISTSVAVAAARALFARGYLDARAMLEASWQDRVDALGEGHYVRYDESTATYLADTSTLLLERYDGDLRRLRAAADHDPDRIRTLLQDAKGIGQLGADIFCREVQTIWPELRPFADRSALQVADQLGLGDSPAALARLHGDDDLSIVTAALLRAKAAKDLEVVREGRPAPPTPTQLAVATKQQLYELARERDVAGRSAMNRGELVDALRR